ncbi:MAG: hypothetical protein KGS09_15545 [Nitrospirae bacterium]|nr:hypothetical protein [Nitrospirota bacterium]MDE3041063.1 hypothetical protein [Nitrospirota bacterium]
MDMLLKMDSADRAFLLLAGHMQNELNSVHKVFAWCLHSRSTDRRSSIERLADGIQAMIYARILAGKLYEARQVLSAAFFATKLWQRVKPRLDPTAQEALKKIEKYFSNIKTIKKVRNSFAFHYSAAEFGLNWEAAADEGPFELILGGTVGNNLHLASELVANTALLSAINSNDREDALRTFFNEVQSVASDFTHFLEGTVVAILEEQFGTSLGALGREEEISPARSYREVSIPFFCKPDTAP